MKYAIVFIIIAAVLGAAGFYFLTKTPAGVDDSALKSAPSEPPAVRQPAEKIMRWNEPPKMEIDVNKKYFAEMETSSGKMKIELFASETPVAVNNFVFLSRQGFYNGTKFHRIIKGFMIQGGDPSGDGTGGPGYRFDDETITRDYERGIVAMANAGPDTNGSQFFIMHQNYPLPKSYVIFGKVLEGLDVLDKIAETPVKVGQSGEPSEPTQDLFINSVIIEGQ